MGSETQILCDVPRDRLLWEFRAPWLCAPGLCFLAMFMPTQVCL